MEDLIKEVESVLQLNVHTSWESYQVVYTKIYGSRWNGCKCKSHKIRIAVEEWYNNNKPK